jgi:DNA-binding beta-propeller fold protein YncE
LRIAIELIITFKGYFSFQILYIILNPMKKAFFLLSCLVMVFINSSVKAQTNYRMGNAIRLEGDGGWDYLKADEVNSRLYVSHGMIANVVDLKTGKSAGTIADTKGIHGIAIANDLNKGYTSNGRDSTVTVFNLKTQAVITIIHKTGRNPDAIIYDPFSQKVFTFNGGNSNSTVIDAKTDKIIATIPLDGKPEFPQSDGKGKLYVNIEDKSLISVINTTTNKVERSWSIAPGEEPSGLALDKLNNLLFSVCGNKLMVVSDAVAGKVITTLPIGDGCDGAVFDPVYKRVYASNGEGTMTVVQEVTPASFKVLETVQTHQGARTITLDNTTHHLYLSCAEYEAAAAGSTGRPKVKPGSFMVLDIETIK